MKRRVAPYGKPLLERHKWKNPPFMVVVSVGMGAWSSAKERLKYADDIFPLVLPDGDSPHKFRWPVKDSIVFIERLPGPGNNVMNELIRALLSAGARAVHLWSKNREPRILSYWAKQ